MTISLRKIGPRLQYNIANLGWIATDILTTDEGYSFDPAANIAVEARSARDGTH